MKRLLVLLLALTMVLSVTACGGGNTGGDAPAAEAPADDTEVQEAPAEEPVESSTQATGEGDTYELALITDLGTIDDKSFNQGAWEGLKAYAEDNDITHKYYQPSEKSTDAYLSAIELAIKGGAQAIVTPGFLFEESIYIAQETYPDIHFILLDGAPNDGDGNYATADNTVGVTYAEHQAGFLAGYAAVKDGATNLGFMGGMSVPAVIRFGYGYVQGADYAAQEMGIDSIPMNYHYTGGFDANPEAQTLAASWYQSGAQVIFGCGGAVGNSVMAAAEAADGKVIGVDVDQSGESATVITSAMKGLGASVYNLLEQHYSGTFPGGQNLVFDASNDGVMLPMDTSKFDTFTQADYDAIYAQLVAGDINIVSDVEISVEDIETTAVNVTFVK